MENDTHNSYTNGNSEHESGNDFKSQSAQQREPEYMRKLFIGGLDFRTTDDTLKSFYEQWGELVDVVVMKDPQTKRSRGFGFVTYSSSSMVDDAQNNRPHVIDGRTVEPKRAIPRNEIHSAETNATVKKLFIAGIKDDVTDEQLRDYFTEYGNVTNVTIVADKNTGKKRGFGFVEFDDYDPVDKACLHVSHTLNGKRVDVKKAVGRTDGAPSRGGGGGGGGGGGRSSGGSDRFGGGGGGGGGRNSGGAWNSGGGSSGGYSGGPWSNNSGPNSNWGGGGGNDRWGGNQGGGGGGGGNFGGGYEDGFGGGPMRGSGGGGGGGPGAGNRSAPYNSGGNFNRSGGGGGFGRGGGGGGGGGGGFRRF